MSVSRQLSFSPELFGNFRWSFHLKLQVRKTIRKIMNFLRLLN